METVTSAIPSKVVKAERQKIVQLVLEELHNLHEERLLSLCTYTNNPIW